MIFHTDILLDLLLSGGKGTHFYNQDNTFDYSVYRKNRLLAVNFNSFLGISADTYIPRFLRFSA